MTTRSFFVRFLPGFFMLAAVSAEVPQSQISFTAGSGGTSNGDWAGVTGRTYFVQWSLDLVHWSYAPLLEFGPGMWSFAVGNENAPKFFVRLHYVDDANVTTLQQAKDADFDGDGLSNLAELTVHFTDPMAADTDGDGLTDREETIDLGLDPTLSNTGTASGASQVSHVYDDGNRLTGTTSPVAVTVYTPDPEGNLLGD